MQTQQRKHPLLAMCVAVSCAWAVQAGAMTRAEYKAADTRIEADYKAAKQRCGGLSNNAKDVCQKEAKGNEKVAKAELQAQYKPSDKAHSKVMEVKADAAYDVAKEKCDDLKGNDKDVCVKDAKAAHTKALGEAKVQKAADTGGRDRANDVAAARQEASKDNREAQYKAAKERCDAMAGDAKDRCVNDVKARFGM